MLFDVVKRRKVKKSRMARRLLLVAVALFTCYVTAPADGARVLAFLPMASKSHANVFLPIMEALTSRGNDVTYVTIYEPPSSLAKSAHFKTVFLHEARAHTDKVIHKSVNLTTISSLLQIGPLLRDNCLKTLNDTTLREFMKYPGEFDVILVNSLINHCYLPVAWQFKIPIIYVSPTTLLNNVAWDLDIPYPLSYVPIPLVPFHSPMTFVQRCTNVFAAFAWQMFNRYYFDWLVHDVVLQYVPNAPHSAEIVRNVSLVLVNSHISLQESRPAMPYVIDVGGMHCRPGRELPKEYENFINGSGEDGFILFSLGTLMQGQFLPAKTIDMLRNVFSKVKQRVIWKFENELDGLGNNTMISAWIPQQDIIAHPKCRLAMTHGGLLSLQEVAYHGVPLLGFPQGLDRDTNLNTAVLKGFAEILDLKTVTEDEMLSTINRMLGDKSYKAKAQEMSSIMKDRPHPPAETAAYWIEYVVRHKGAPHLKSGASHLNLMQHLLLDVYAAFAAILVLFVLITFYVIRFLWRRCCRQASGKSNQKKE